MRPSLEMEGLFEVTLKAGEIPDYRLRLSFAGGQALEIDDPYRYGRVLTDFDVHLFGEGTHLRIFEKLGAHRVRVPRTCALARSTRSPMLRSRAPCCSTRS